MGAELNLRVMISSEVSSSAGLFPFPILARAGRQCRKMHRSAPRSPMFLRCRAAATYIQIRVCSPSWSLDILSLPRPRPRPRPHQPRGPSPLSWPPLIAAVCTYLPRIRPPHSESCHRIDPRCHHGLFRPGPRSTMHNECSSLFSFSSKFEHEIRSLACYWSLKGFFYTASLPLLCARRLSVVREEKRRKR